MAKYSDIKGFTVQTLSSDTVASQFVGGTWSSGGALNTARSGLTSNAVGTQTAGMASGGSVSPKQQNEQYNGSSWTEVGDLTSAHSFAGAFGTSTASILAGGEDSTVLNTVEVWDGSSWTETTEINTARSSMGSYGSSYTAGAVIGGYSTTNTSLNENWNGSAWTELNDLNTARHGLGAGGTTTSALAGGGQSIPVGVNAETWNGSSWTAVSNINAGRTRWAMTATDSTSAIGFGGTGSPSYVGSTEVWDGSSWTEVADMATGRNGLAGSGTSAESLASGGYTGSVSALTEEFSAPAVFNQIHEGQLFFNSTTNTFKETITDLGAGAWASGANINTAREGTAGAGDSAEAALLVGGYTTSSPTIRVANVESWDGSSWTEVNDLNSARYLLASSGTNTAALAYGGNTPPPAVTAVTESWNGSSWTEVNDLNTARQSLAGVGPYTSALAFGGTTPTKVADTETWDGTNWTEVADLNTARGLQASVGVTQTAALSVSGNFPQANQVEEWDGSSWTEIAEVNTARYNPSGNGSSTIGLIFGGRILGGSPPAAYSALTESWNGTAWTERADLATARGDGASANNISNNSKALYFSGSNPPYVYTEEWTAPLANKTITAS